MKATDKKSLQRLLTQYAKDAAAEFEKVHNKGGDGRREEQLAALEDAIRVVRASLWQQ